MDDYKNYLENLIERRFSVDRDDIPYEELKENEKIRIQEKMGDVIEVYPELEELIPEPINWM